MNLCDDGHAEVCFEGRKCPVCETINDKNREIDDMQKQIIELEQQLDNLTE